MENGRRAAAGSDDPASGLLAAPWKVLQAARRAVPAVDYALGAAGVAAAGAIVTSMIGKDKASVVILGGMLVAMVLLFVFARLSVAKSAAVTNAGIVLLWAVTVFFCVFLMFTASAFALGWPRPWAVFLGVDQPDRPAPASEARIHCAPVLANDHIVQRCQLTMAEARATARNMLNEVIDLVAHVLSSKDHLLFPRMEDYMREPNEVQRETRWKEVKDAIGGDKGLITTIEKASTALIDLDARLRTQAGAGLARDPMEARAIVKEIQTKPLKRRRDIVKEIAQSEKPSNEQAEEWYRELKDLVGELENDLKKLEQQLALPA
jgi:hypothetical protein